MIAKLALAVVLVAAGAASVAALRAGEHTDRPRTATDIAAQATPAAAGLLSARLLDCALGRITNFDPDKDQTVADYKFEGRYRLKLFLPPIPVRTTPPPQAPRPPEPVDPRTRIVADPDGLASPSLRFNRVVDLWPERVEMTAPISDTAVKLVVVTGADPRTRTADIFVANANDAVTYDLAQLYTGTCKVALDAAMPAGG